VLLKLISAEQADNDLTGSSRSVEIGKMYITQRGRFT